GQVRDAVTRLQFRRSFRVPFGEQQVLSGATPAQQPRQQCLTDLARTQYRDGSHTRNSKPCFPGPSYRPPPRSTVTAAGTTPAAWPGTRCGPGCRPRWRRSRTTPPGSPGNPPGCAANPDADESAARL